MSAARTLLLTVALATSLLSACGGDDPSGPDSTVPGKLSLSLELDGDGGGDATSIVHHDVDGVPIETLDTVNDVLCGVTTDLSLFVLAVPGDVVGSPQGSGVLAVGR